MKKDKEETNENDDDNKQQKTMQMPVKYMQMLKRPRIYRKIMRRDRKR